MRAGAASVGSTLAIVAILGALWLFQVPAWFAPPAGRVETLQIPAPSQGGGVRRAVVYVPAGYGAGTGSAPIPVLYALHGWPGNPEQFFRMGRISDTAEELLQSGAIGPMLIVAPDGSGQGLMGYGGWVNSADGQCELETFVARDLVAAVDEHYNTIKAPSGRAIMGISDGGYGAMNIGLHHPEVFGIIVSHSGHYTADSSVLSNRTFGTGAIGVAARRENSPAAYITEAQLPARMPQILMDSSTLDTDLKDSKAFDALLTRLSVPHEFDVSSGLHFWPLWRSRFHYSLQWVSRQFARGPRE